MKNTTLLIAGGTGFIGQALVTHLSAQGFVIWVLGRDSEKIKAIFGDTVTPLQWDTLQQCDTTFDGIINLTGESIASGRWSKARKARLISSRLNTTRALVQFCLATQFKLSTQLESKQQCRPMVFIQASAIGFYGDQGQHILTENSAPKPCFAHSLCQQWEAAIDPLITSNIRVCIARLGVVLDKNNGAFPQMAMPFKGKLALRQGNGTQWFSWLSLSDALAAFTWLIQQPRANGIYNFTSPMPLTNTDFTHWLGEYFRCHLKGFIPAALLRLMLGEMADELILVSQRVVPLRLQTEGFIFQHPTLRIFLDDDKKAKNTD
jgi:hypothetical protein